MPPPPAPRLRQPAIRRSLRLLAAVVLVLIAAVTSQQMLQLRSSLLADTERQIERLAMVFAEQTGRAMETVDLILRNAIEAASPDMRIQPERATDMGAMFRRRLAGVQQVLEVAVVDPKGRVLAASWTDGHELQPEARPLVAWHSNYPADELRISRPFRLPDGRWTAVLTRRIGPPDALAGVALAWINLAYFSDFYRSVELSENGAIILHRRDGVALMRHPFAVSAIGKSFADTPLFTDILARGMAGTMAMDSPVDGSRRIATIRALRNFPFAIQVSVEQGAVLASWRGSAMMFGLIAAIAATVIVALLLLLAQRSGEVERLLEETRAARDEAEAANVRLRAEMEERARAEAALRQAQRIEVMGQLTGGVAHDFNNLLTVLLGNLDLIELDGPPSPVPGLPPRLAERIAAMREAAERGAAMTTQLLAFSRHAPLLTRAVDLNAVVGGLGDLLASVMGPKIQVEFALAPGLPPASVDPAQVELVLMNLALNARDAMPDGGTLRVATERQRLGLPQQADDPAAGEYVVLRVTDGGRGMTEDVQARALEPYFTTKGPGGGSGLGLSQVYGVARQSGGGVRIDSAPGRGTAISVLLPRAEGPAAAIPRAEPPAPRDPPRDGRITILLVDDDAAVRMTTAMILQERGYEVLELEDGIAALDLLRGGTPVDILVTDIAMPGISGPELARRLTAVRPSLPVLFLSGYADPDILGPEAPGAPRRRLVRKPYRPAELAAEIDAALAERPQSQAAQ